jgi:Mannitol-1-phosphate/altronate dehydrogenases
MLTLNRETVKNAEIWAEAGMEALGYDYTRMTALTRENPTWVHFGAGNIFRGFIAMLQQTLLNDGRAETGIVAVEPYDYEIIEKIYRPHDDLSLLAVMHADGSLEKKIVGSIGESLVGDCAHRRDWERLQAIFARPSLQMASFTITEKGYKLTDIAGNYLPAVAADMEAGPDNPASVMGKIAALAYARYRCGALPLALVSMDNCSHNGEKLHDAVAAFAGEWEKRGLAAAGFADYIDNPRQVGFPWSMIDKITPRPSASVKSALTDSGFIDTGIVRTAKNTFIAPFVNAEKPEYLVIEDVFPNGRMPLEHAGVIFADRQTVDRVEKMKVCTCLNPLHTALAVFGCLLGHTLIADEMRDPALKKLVEKIGYEEGLPVVVDPGIINPEDFLREVIEVRLPNPYIPDTPQRIATDTSQKVGIRFGETIKAYCRRPDLDVESLTYIPLAIAGWCRYLLGLGDNGKPMELSPDPLLARLQGYVDGIGLGDGQALAGRLEALLANEEIFGVNLYAIGMGNKIAGYACEMAAGPGAVRATLHKYLPAGS